MGYMKSISDRLGRWEKAEQGNLQDWIKSKIKRHLAGVAQWTECRPANQRVTSLIASLGTCLGCRPGPQ